MNTKLIDYIKQITPAMDLAEWQPKCPECSNPIEVDRQSYFIFGQRHWCYGVCGECKTKFVLDVPTLLYNFWFPQIMNINTRKVYGKPSWWQWDMAEIYFHYYLQEPLSENLQKPTIFSQIQKALSFLMKGDFKYLVNKTRILLTSRQEQNQPAVKPLPPSLKIEIKNPDNYNSILLFNCLDEYYGHATRFIQFVYNTYDEIGDKLREEGIGTAILLPEYLQFYAPDFINEIWVGTHLPAPFGRKTFRNLQFNLQVNEEIKKRNVYLLKKQPNIGVGVDARRYFKMDIVEKNAQISISPGKPIFVFYHREDLRCWGGHPKLELKNYSRLADLLKNYYPEAVIYLVGMKKTYPIKNKNIIDFRTNGLEDNYQQRQMDYLYLLSHTDCAVGIHGSHMTEITALAKSVITLQLKDKYHNYTDDMFLIKSDSLVPESCRFLPVFGNRDLDNVSPEYIFDIIETALTTARANYLRFYGLYDQV